MFRALSHRAARLVLVAGPVTLLLSGCGNQYRPVVSTTNPVGPAQQPTKYAVAISTPSGNTPGLLTFVDVSGDTVMSTPSIQTNPSYLAIAGNTTLNGSGSVGYTINPSGAVNAFGVGNPTGLLTSDIVQATLPTGSAPSTISPFALGGSSANVFIPETGTSRVAALSSSGSALTLVQDVSVPATPVYVVGTDNTQRAYVLSSNGVASSLEASTNSGISISATIPVGVNPVYGVMTPDTRRAFIVNKGSQSVSVINVVNNALDVGVNSGAGVGTIAIPTVTDAAGNNLSANPIWADLQPLTNELVVLSAGDGVHGGLVSIISIPLCSSIALPSNPNCNTANPVDATGFGTVLATVPVGPNPTMLSVLRDATQPRAYVANSGSGSASGSVSVVNLNSGTVTATLPTAADGSNVSTPSVFGLHPSSIAATTGTPTGKVYVTSPDSRFLTVINTDTDTVLTHIPLLGNGVRVVLTAP